MLDDNAYHRWWVGCFSWLWLVTNQVSKEHHLYLLGLVILTDYWSFQWKIRLCSTSSIFSTFADVISKIFFFSVGACWSAEVLIGSWHLSFIPLCRTDAYVEPLWWPKTIHWFILWRTTHSFVPTVRYEAMLWMSISPIRKTSRHFSI